MPRYKIKVVKKCYEITEFEVLGDDEFDARLVAETHYGMSDPNIFKWEYEEGECWIDEVEEIGCITPKS